MSNKDNLNALARKLYAAQGYNVAEGYDFSTARHPQEQGMWIFAVMSFNFWSEILENNKDE